LIEAKYLYAETLFGEKNYQNAKRYYQEVGEYKEAKVKATACDLMEAEAEYKKGNLNAAKTAYGKLPSDFSFNGISVQERQAFLKNNESFVKICGTWKASKDRIETRHYYKRNGTFESWHLTNLQADQKIEVRCIPNANGTFTIKGSVSFYRYTNYASTSYLLNKTKDSKSFTISDVKKIPSSYAINSYTTLKYSNGVFSIKYSKNEDYSQYYYNQYNSSVTYGTNTGKY
jgi:hypothetical protein